MILFILKMETKNILIAEKGQSKLFNKRNKFTKIKSDYFLERLFGNMNKKIKLEIIKYNKNIQKRLKININDYKEYSEIYSSIEIEIIPHNDIIFYKFINIKKVDEKYYHIYFNNNKKDEIKRAYLKAGDKVSKINIIIDYQIKSFFGLFSNCKCIESIKFKKFYRNNINDMSAMFFGCSQLKELDLSNFNTSNVTNMSQMFAICSSLKELNLSNFNTNNVTDMSQMFYKCSSLKELNLSNFNTNNVKDMIEMFSQCPSLEKLNISNFNTNNVKNLAEMFMGCSSLKELDVSNFNINNETNLLNMFGGCKSLKELNLSNFKTNNVELMCGMFYKCSKELILKIKSRYKNFKEESFDTMLNTLLNIINKNKK